MKRWGVYFLVVWSLLLSGKTEAVNRPLIEDAFLLSGTHLKSTIINQSFSQKGDLAEYPVTLDKHNAIFGASISAQITLFSEASLARVILIDNIGNEYLIYEVYSLIASNNSFSIQNLCEETKLLNAIIPVSLRIELLSASLSLHDLSVATSAPCKRNDIIGYQQEIKEEQERQKINLLNAMIKAKGMSWIAGHTSLSSLTYAQKKMMFNQNDMLANLQGFEYHAGGVFVVKSHELEISIETKQTMIDSFDWRTRHGATNPESPYYDGDSLGTGWDTKVKDQAVPQYCGSCWAHSTLASAELLANLYYNQHINMDLSEQYIMECSNACSAGKGCNGGNPSKASAWVVNKGVMEEAAFPYVASNSPKCGDSIAEPLENLRFPKSFNVRGSSISEDSLKRMLVHYGPLNVAGCTPGHAMSLVGYKKSNNKTVWIYKDSHGLSSGTNGFRDVTNSIRSATFSGYKLPISSRIYDDDDIKCIDLDRDGYYNWGIGPKPKTCPEGCPDEGDCDDSRNDLGPMLPDGSCKEIPVDIQVKNLPSSEIIYNFNPNPFKNYTTINFQVLNDSKTVIRIYNLAGTIIKTFTLTHNQEGLQSVFWDGTNQQGELISNGLYICKIEMGNKDTQILKSIKLYVSR